GLKIPRWQHRTGSTPVSGTTKRPAVPVFLFEQDIFLTTTSRKGVFLIYGVLYNPPPPTAEPPLTKGAFILHITDTNGGSKPVTTKKSPRIAGAYLFYLYYLAIFTAEAAASQVTV
ncbi:MAG: hypothetical protein IJC70_03010, partial [Firmicutes bacterium]|nr:hypothetical protein [Bacillota bacterium]